MYEFIITTDFDPATEDFGPTMCSYMHNLAFHIAVHVIIRVPSFGGNDRVVLSSFFWFGCIGPIGVCVEEELSDDTSGSRLWRAGTEKANFGSSIELSLIILTWWRQGRRLWFGFVEEPTQTLSKAWPNCLLSSIPTELLPVA